MFAHGWPSLAMLSPVVLHFLFHCIHGSTCHPLMPEDLPIPLLKAVHILLMPCVCVCVRACVHARAHACECVCVLGI